MRRVEVWIPVDGEPAATAGLLRRTPGIWLPAPASERGPDHWGVTLRAGPIERMATCGVGEASGEDDAVRRRIIWSADPESSDGADRALPSFDGALLLRAVGDRRANLALEGSYTAPDGMIGLSLGPPQVRALAEAAAIGFLEAVAARILGEDPEPEPDTDGD